MTTSPVTVYSKPACVQCDATDRALDKHGMDYDVVDLTQDPTALELGAHVISAAHGDRSCQR